MEQAEGGAVVKSVRTPLGDGNWDSIIDDMVDAVVDQKRRRNQEERQPQEGQTPFRATRLSTAHP